MNSDQEEHDRLLQKHARELVDLEIRQAIRRALPDFGLPFKIHVSELYGTAASVALEFDFYGQAKSQPDLDAVRRLGETLPGVPLVFIQDGCAWFAPREYLDSLPPYPQSRGVNPANVTEVCPFHVRVSAFQRQTTEFSWIAQVAGRLVRVEVVIPTPLELGISRCTYADIPGRRMLTGCAFLPGPKLRDLPNAKLASPVKFAAGGEDTPNAFEVYYIGLATIVDFVKMIRG